MEGVRNIEWNNNAFDSLVLPGDYKELILALIESQSKNRESFDKTIKRQRYVATPKRYHYDPQLTSH